MHQMVLILFNHWICLTLFKVITQNIWLAQVIELLLWIIIDKVVPFNIENIHLSFIGRWTYNHLSHLVDLLDILPFLSNFRRWNPTSIRVTVWIKLILTWILMKLDWFGLLLAGVLIANEVWLSIDTLLLIMPFEESLVSNKRYLQFLILILFKFWWNS